MSDTAAQDALFAALEHFAELASVLDDAITKARRLDDPEMVERLVRARAAADQGALLVRKLRGIVSPDNEAGQASVN